MLCLQLDNIEAYLLKARTVKPVETAVIEWRLRKQACFHGKSWIRQREAVFSTQSVARCYKQDS
jgi:hypothetical protein